MARNLKAYVWTHEDQESLLKSLHEESAQKTQLILPKSIEKKPEPPAPDIFTPTTFDQYMGQVEAKELARIMVTASRKEKRPLPNILVVGEYGLGKTTLAKIIHREYGIDPVVIDASSINREIPMTGDFLIDEIHNLTPDVADTLNIYLDSGNLRILGCTTDEGQLPSAFRSRFRPLFLQSYSVDDLTSILEAIIKRKGVTATRSTIKMIAARSRFNARQATQYISFIFDYMVVLDQRTITPHLVQEAFAKLGVDDNGFVERDRRFMAALPDDRAVGLQYLAAITGINEKTIEQEVEPYLLRMGKLDRSSRGRIKMGEIDTHGPSNLYRTRP
jgi:Holliday junction DNA helicase RuvB